jgi:hypothetical protein
MVGSHESLVQTFLSSQFGAGPPLQTLAEQVSFSVHLFPSSQELLFWEYTHLWSWSHLSSVQGLLSSHWPQSQLLSGPAVPHSKPVHWLAQPVVHAPVTALQSDPSGHVPQVPPQPSFPHCLSLHCFRQHALLKQA